MFFLSCYTDPRDLPSFPTRRSSDLITNPIPHSMPGNTPLINRNFKTPVLGEDSLVDVVAVTFCKRGASELDRKSTRLNSSHANISYAVFCLKKKTKKIYITLSAW